MRSAFVVLLIDIIVFCPVVSWAQGTVIRACDLAAASPTDPTRPENIVGIRTERIDPKVALPACKAALAVEPENPRLLFETGRILEVGKNDAQARIYYEKAAAFAHAGARNNLAMFYLKGRGGLPKDDTKAAELLKLAADQGLANAQYNLGALYANGRGGLQKNNEQAVHYLKLAADQGEANAQAILGVCYINGVGGLPKDDMEAARLLKLAANQGSSVGQFNLGFFYETGRGGLPKSDEEAARLYKLAAEQGWSGAQYRLALLYEAGRGGLPKNNEEAKRLYKLAAEHGYPNALSRLETLNANGHSHLCKADDAADQSQTNADLLQTEVAAVRRRISSCWFPPPGVDANTNISLTIRVLLNPDGSLKQEPILASITPSSPALGHALADSALQAVRLAQPFTMLQPENYSQWKELELVFNPHWLLDPSKQNTNSR
jgi:TPR repeat protein